MKIKIKSGETELTYEQATESSDGPFFAYADNYSSKCIPDKVINTISELCNKVAELENNKYK